MAVLGAGGAARGVIHALLECGHAEVRVFNRTRDRADVVARHFGPRVKPYDWRDRGDRSRDVGRAGQRHLARHEGRGRPRHAARAAAPMPASSPTSSTCRWRRRCWRRRGRAASPPSTASACCCIRRCPASRNGSACARGHRRAARAGRRRHRGPLMLVVGLTGSIGMGKSTVAARLRALGHWRMRRRRRGAQALRGCGRPSDRGGVSRHDGRRQGRPPEAGSRLLLADPAGFKRLEAIVHPLVFEAERAFLRARGGHGRSARGAGDPAPARERWRAPRRCASSSCSAPRRRAARSASCSVPA